MHSQGTLSFDLRSRISSWLCLPVALLVARGYSDSVFCRRPFNGIRLCMIN